MASEMSVVQPMTYEEGERIFAIKQINVGGNWFGNMVDGEKISCKYLVQRADTFIDKDNNGSDLFFVVTDLYEDGDLNTFLLKNSHLLCTDLILEWSCHLLIGAHALRKQSIYRSNIRPSQIMVTDGGQTIKLYDYGTSGQSSNLLGSNLDDEFIYKSVEALDSGNDDIEGKNDVYKIACTVVYLFIMLDILRRDEDGAESPADISEQVFKHSFF